MGLGSQPKQTTAAVHNASEGFSGWIHQDFTFKADATTDTLSFLSVGTPSGLPPLALLDGVTFAAASAPEPSTWVLMLIGVGGLGVMARRGRQIALASLH